MSYVDRPQTDKRPVDDVWPDRLIAAAKQSCSIGKHPVTDEQIASWSAIDRSEYYISFICPACWNEFIGTDEED